MKDTKCTVRYLGYQTLPDGGRGFNFSLELVGEAVTLITVEAPVGLFSGPDHMAIQEGAGICYQTLKARIETNFGQVPSRFNLTLGDVSQHRKVTGVRSRAHANTRAVLP